MSKCWGLDITVLQSGMAAAAHFLTEWRKALVKHLNKDLKPLAEAQFTDRGPFGEDFGKRARSTADISALKRVQYKKSRALFFRQRRLKQEILCTPESQQELEHPLSPNQISLQPPQLT